MKLLSFIFVIWKLVLILVHLANSLHDGRETATDYYNQWIVRIEGDFESANSVAADLGYTNLGELTGFPNYYLMKKEDHPETVREETILHTRSLEDDYKVIFAQQLFNKVRVKRDVLFDGIRGVSQELYELWNQVTNVPQKQSSDSFGDPFWRTQWYLQSESLSRQDDQVSLHVLECFAMNITGHGIRITVLDDGLEHTHSDLKDNYDSEISWDYNSGFTGDNDPTPVSNHGYPNSHGTRCAGEIAMKPNNHVCGVGVAYGAKIGGIRMLDGKIDDRIEGESLKHALDKVDIYTSSWGPQDDGKRVEGPGHLAKEAIRRGITEGRDGKGAIYVWAAGNGGIRGDNCNCDGYTSNIHTISIGSASSRGKFTWYGERCASTMAVTYSSGDSDEPKISTTDTNNECTDAHTGTSAAAPLAAGIIGLTLQANNNLTWRDVQHLLVHTSLMEPLINNDGWYENSAGLKYNHRFGFGLLNAKKMVDAALQYKNVDKQETCEIPVKVNKDDTIQSGTLLSIPIDVNCLKIDYLEHVQAFATIDTDERGLLEIALESPTGDFTQLLTQRREDTSNKGFQDWPFTSNHFWGTNPNGKFKIHFIYDRENKNNGGKYSHLRNLKLILYGTKNMPPIMKDKQLRSTESQPNFYNVESFLQYENQEM